jgi:hypothetical protein
LDHDLARRKNTALEPRHTYKVWEPHRYFRFPVSAEQILGLIEKAKREENRGMLGAFDQGNGFLCAAPTIEEVLELLEGMKFIGDGRPYLVQIVTADSFESLYDMPWDREIENAARVIRFAREQGDKRATKYLSSALRSTGVKPGPKRTEKYNRDRIGELRQRMGKIGLKQIPTGGDTVKQGRAISAKLLRFCKEVRYHYKLMGLPDVSEACDGRFAAWFNKKLAFNLPEELPLVNYALALAPR